MKKKKDIELADAPVQAPVTKQTTNEDVRRARKYNRSDSPAGVVATMDNAYVASNYSKFIKILPNADQYLKANGTDQMTYRELKKFPICKTTIQRRKYGVLKMMMDIDRERPITMEAEFIKKELLANLDKQRIISDILDAPQFGWRVQEVYWNEKNGMILPTDIVAKPNDWFGVDRYRNLRFKTRENPVHGEIVPAKKFLVTFHEADQYEAPYGEPILSSCFWAVHFMKGGQRLYMRFLNKYGIPYLHGKVRRGSDPADTDELFEYLEDLQQDGIVVTPDDQDINILDVGGKASADLWRGLREDMRADIIEMQLGHEGAIVNTPGKLGSDDTALNASKDITEADAQMVCSTINKLIRWTIDANFWSPSDYPEVKLYARETMDTGRALRDSYLMKDPTLRFTKKYYMNNYGFKDDELEIVPTKDSALPPDANAPADPMSPADVSVTEPITVEPGTEVVEQFSAKLTTADQVAIDNAIKALSADGGAAMKEFLAPAIKLIKECKDFGEASRRISSLMGQMPDDNLRQSLFTAIFGAKVIGHASSSLESNNATN